VKKTASSLFLCFTLALVGCDPDRSQYKIQLQPDGSGRVRVAHEEGKNDWPDRAPAPPESSEARAQGHATTFLGSIEGVAAWSDVEATPLASGRGSRVEAVGWFQSLADVRLPQQHAFSASVVEGCLEVRYRDPLPARVAQVLTGDRARTMEALTMADLEFASVVHRLRGAMELSLAAWSFDAEVQLPGLVVESAGFTRVADDRVGIRRDVNSALALLERDVASVVALRRAIQAGTLTPEAAFVKLGEDLERAAPCVARCPVGELPLGPDTAFATAFDAAVTAWQGSSWRTLILERRR
jgi:hypothetical protein